MTESRTIPACLMAWYHSSGRCSPFASMGAYAIWVSEVMLQQTQMQTALPYHRRFMERFPTLPELADAPVHDVLAIWSGLGYYARARKLHAAARQVCREFAGSLPRTVVELRSLPGVGPYTAGAVASQAFRIRVPAVDANAARVLCRLFAVAGDPKAPTVFRKLEQLSAEMMPTKDPGTFNVALMVFGADVCRPKNPDCAACTLQDHCKAHRNGRTADYPAVSKRPTAVHQLHAAGLLQDSEGRALLVCRPDDGLWGGMWELPRVVQEPGEAPWEAATRAVRDYTGIEARPVKTFGTVKHSVMHYRITLTGVKLERSAGRRPASRPVCTSEWVAPSAASSRALPAPQRRLLELALAAPRHGISEGGAVE